MIILQVWIYISKGLGNICTRKFKHRYGGNITSLDLYFQMGPPMSENQVKESQSHVASYHSPRRGMGLADALRGSALSIQWLCDQLSTPALDIDDVTLERSTCGFILALFGSFLFADKKGV